LKPTLWRLTAASVGVLAALSLNVTPASASSSKGAERPESGPVQVARQASSTDQDAHSSAKSEQFLPINANAPVQVLSLGSNGGKTMQSNNSAAWSDASNQAWTGQSLHQSQSAPQPEGRKGHDDRKPEGHGPKCDRSKDHGSKDQGPAPAFQGASQQARTHQDADSSARSEQFLPINANVPVQILSLGSNGGDTTQSNNSTAKSSAANEAWTDQSAGQHQSTWGPSPKGDDGWKPEGHGPNDQGSAPAIQGADQQARTHQDADSSATSKQIAPVNANVPIQVLSLGSNGGDTTQSNNSTAKSSATNEAGTDQSASQHQQAGPAPAFQGSSQQASTNQDAHSSARSEQIAPINANVPVQILSLGSNGGATTQSNNSQAASTATNQAGTSQVLGQAQGPAFGLLG
jgi:hypothetical protein